jgi:tetratricopeptide (TPR) repeat protein
LADHIGPTPLRYPLLVAQWRRALGLGLDETLELAREVHRLAEAEGDRAMRVGAFRCLANTLWFQGRLQRSMRYADRGLELRDKTEAQASAIIHLSEPGISCLTFSAIDRWLLGDPDEAQRRGEQSIQEAKDLNHPHTLAVALFYFAMLLQWRRDFPQTQSVADELLKFSTDHGFASWKAAAITWKGWLAACAGDEKGYQQIASGVAQWEAGGLLRLRQYFWSLFADATLEHFRKTKLPIPPTRIAQDLDMLTRGIATVTDNDEHWWEPELYRLRAELLMRDPLQQDEAERSLDRALRRAKATSSVMLERRALQTLRDFNGSHVPPVAGSNLR